MYTHTYIRRFPFSIHRIDENCTSVSLGWPCRCAAWALVGSRQGPPSGSGSWCQKVARSSGPIGGPHHPSLGRGTPTRHHLGWWYALVSALNWGPGSGSGNKANRGRRKAKRTKPTYECTYTITYNICRHSSKAQQQSNRISWSEARV